VNFALDFEYSGSLKATAVITTAILCELGIASHSGSAKPKSEHQERHAWLDPQLGDAGWKKPYAPCLPHFESRRCPHKLSSDSILKTLEDILLHQIPEQETNVEF